MNVTAHHYCRVSSMQDALLVVERQKSTHKELLCHNGVDWGLVAIVPHEGDYHRLVAKIPQMHPAM